MNLTILEERTIYQEQLDNEKNLKRRTMEFKKALEENQVLEEFDRKIFESIVEKVIVGKIDEEGNKNTYKLTFVYKTGISNRVDSKQKRDTKIGKAVKDSIQKICSYVGNEVKNVHSQMQTGKCGNDCLGVKKNQSKIISLKIAFKLMIHPKMLF